MKAWQQVQTTEPELAKQLLKAKEDILENAFCGIQIQKDLIPKEYIQKYNINNLWKYNLPNAWRLLYSITTPNKIEIISVVLDWVSHKYYERILGY
jgi:hypothetical protein